MAGWALILGVSGGTGGAAAVALSRDPGLDVFGIHRGRHPEDAARVAGEVQANCRRCRLFEAGAGTQEEARAGAAELLQVAGPKSVRIFVHALADGSYGRLVSGPSGGLSARQVQKTFDTMAHSFLYWAQELSRHDLLADGARLVALTNPMVDSAVHGWGLIAAAKAALEVYVRQVGHELGPAGYRVSLVKFGLVETRAIRIAFTPDDWMRVKSEIARCTPARRLCTVEEVARFLSHLAGDGGEWFTAATIDLSGGQTGALLDRIFNPDKEQT
jgi:NAD(P)-dependent dehydrogenase (short-subunit alcohol dehydrogenase family)